MGLTAYLLVLIFVWTGSAVRFAVPSCNQHMFYTNADDCLSDFNKTLETSGYRESCPWPAVKSVYRELKYCVDDCQTASSCGGHSFLVDKVFLKVHHMYFSLCGQVQDPPFLTLIMLIAPSIIATVLLPLLCANLATCERYST